MRKFAVCIVMSTMGALGLFAAEFPYGVQSWSERFASSGLLEVSSLTTPVSVTKKSDMPASDSLAVVTLNNAKITAMDEETWTEAIAAISQTDVQAAFTLKLKDDTTTSVWMGYSGGEWLELSAPANSSVAPAEGQWDVKIEFDYSLGANARKIRYLIRSTGTGDYTALKYDNSEWIDIGVEKSVIAGVDLYGFGTASAAGAESGARQASGTASGVAECSMDYSDLKLTVTRSSSAADTWADQIQVAVKKNGTNVGTATVNLPAMGESAVIDLAKELPDIVPGETYDYDVSFAKTYGNVTQTTKIAQASGTINMFSSIDWFGFNGEGFVNATTTNITVDANKFGATDDELKGAINPDKAADEGQQTIVTSHLTVTSAFPDDELTFELAAGAQFAVVLATENNVRQWKYFNGSAWVVADTADIPTVNGDYVGTATFDYRDGKKTVTYTIEYGGVTKTLASGVSLRANTKLNGVDIMGGGFGEMNALCKTTGAAPVEPEGTTITLESNSKVDLANLSGDYTVESVAGKSFHLRWDDAGNKYAKMDGNTLTVVPGTPANGMKSYDSYVLGLEADESDSKPEVVVKQGVSQEDGIVVEVPNLTNIRTELGYTVKLQLMQSTNGGTKWTTSGTAVDAGLPLTIPFDGTKLYRVDTIIR